MIEIVLSSKKYWDPVDIAKALAEKGFEVDPEKIYKWLKQGWAPKREGEGKLILLEDVHVDGDKYYLAEKFVERLLFLYPK